ncbi:MAG: lipoate--protein ligase [Clostridiales Family XIII bacterium]|jgi:lipoate-protein ligase A|nr:lipoate--protein ligase [Clostridiales Family XIII bacterium]
MSELIYIEPRSTEAAFHFAAEEYCMRHFQGKEPIWMIWQTEKCAMLGRNQIAAAEIDLAEAEKSGVQIVRRSSGGGTIFTDLGALLFTVILPYGENDDAKQMAMCAAAEPVIRALYQMGIPARLEGRNDILVDGKKVSGLAQFIAKGKLCSHGSLLFDTDLEELTRFLKTDEGKIKSKALRSMRSRVTNLIEYLESPCPPRIFWDRLKQHLFEDLDIREYHLTEQDIREIEAIRAEKYANPEWTFGKAPKFSFANAKRFPGGKIETYLEIEKGRISECRIHGDFLSLVSVRSLEEQLKGRTYRVEDVRRTLETTDLRPCLGSITAEELIACMFNIVT